MANNADTIARIETVRGKIAELQTKRKAVASEPCTHSEAHERIDQHVDAIARGASPGDGRVSNPPQIEIERLKPVAFVPGVFPLCEFDSYEQGFAVLPPDALKSFLHARLDEHLVEQPQGISHDARRKTLAKLDREIRKLEIEEEAAICAFEDSGLSLHRRADASPEVVLEVEYETDEAA